MGSACKHIFERFLPKRTSAFSLQTKKTPTKFGQYKNKNYLCTAFG